MLADEGRLGLDDPAADHVPGLRGRRPGPTVRQLLNHTAGFSNPLPIRWVRADAAHDSPTDDLLERLLAKHGRPTHPIGGAAHYSNLGYLVLGAVIEAAAGEPFACYVRRAILRPLGMDRTDFVHTRPDLAATGYVKAPRVVAPILRAVLPEGIVGPRIEGRSTLNPFTVLGPSYGGLIGPASDAARFAAMHLNDGELDGVRILRPETAIDMRRISALGRQRDIGNGWFASAKHRVHDTPLRRAPRRRRWLLQRHADLPRPRHRHRAHDQHHQGLRPPPAVQPAHRNGMDPVDNNRNGADVMTTQTHDRSPGVADRRQDRRDGCERSSLADRCSRSSRSSWRSSGR